MPNKSFAEILAEASKTLEEIEANKKGVPSRAATQLDKPSVPVTMSNGNGRATNSVTQLYVRRPVSEV